VNFETKEIERLTQEAEEERSHPDPQEPEAR
jgi:hypothetical protein